MKPEDGIKDGYNSTVFSVEREGGKKRFVIEGYGVRWTDDQYEIRYRTSISEDDAQVIAEMVQNMKERNV